MLSRAAEGQIAEQRELANAISDVRNQLMRITQELAEMRVRPSDENTDAQINAVTVEMREAVRFLSERLDGVARMVAQRGEELADIRTALTAIDAHVRSQAETIGVLSTGLQVLPSYGERVSVLQDNLQVLHRQLVGIEESLAAPAEDLHAAERLGGIESSVSAVGARLTAIESAASSIAERLTAMESAAAGSGDEDRIAALESAVAPVRDRLEEVSEIGTAQSALLSQLQNAAMQLQDAVARLHDRVEPIASDITAIGTGVTGLVEGSADGAALDARVTESVANAMREAEQRLTAHVDEAVLALAQTLLRHRQPGAAPADAAPADGGDAASPDHSEPVTAEPVAATSAHWWEPATPEAAAIPSTTDYDAVVDEPQAPPAEPDEAAVQAEEPARVAVLDEDDDVDEDGIDDAQADPPTEIWVKPSTPEPVEADPTESDSVESDATDAEASESDVPESDAPESDAPETAVSETSEGDESPPPAVAASYEQWTPQTPAAGGAARAEAPQQPKRRRLFGRRK
jgi:predicted  nucleic acid-binding Zn-ribbon protein